VDPTKTKEEEAEKKKGLLVSSTDLKKTPNTPGEREPINRE